MLVLSRKKNEALVMTIPAGTLITEDLAIRVMITEIRTCGMIRMGTEAPRFVRISRERAAKRSLQTQKDG
jgi:sRNA-binding carbon storage regulator CsrA